MKLKFLHILILSALIYSCDDSTTGIGDSTIANGDPIPAGTALYQASTRSILSDSVYARTSTAYLGKYTDSHYGEFSADFIAQFNCVDNFEFPKTFQEIKEVQLRMYYGNFFGDPSNAMRLQVDTLSQIIPEKALNTFYTNVDPSLYYDPQAKPLARKAFAAKGSSVHILGQRSDRASNTTDYFERNMSVAQRENEVIVMEEGYETRYTHFDASSPEAFIGYALQWKAHYESSLLFAAEVVDKLMVNPLVPRKIAIDQDIFQVLVEANMPAVLLELAFISNAAEYRYLASKDGQEAIAERLFQAFKSYKTQYDRSLNIEASEQPAAPALVEQAPAASESQLSEYYTVQIMSVAKVLKPGDPSLKGVKAEAYKPEGTGTYKYIVGKFSTREEAQKELAKVKEKFPGAFIIYIK